VPEDDAMEKVTSEAALRKAALPMGPDSIEARARGRIRAWIEDLIEAELTTVFGAEVSERRGAPRQRDALLVAESGIGFTRCGRAAGRYSALFCEVSRLIHRRRNVMRMCLLFLGVAGVAVLASGQTAPAQGRRPFIAPPWQQMTADSIARADTGIWRMRGSVRIVQETAIITADEVDARIAPDGTVDYDFRGSVHLTMTPHR
jgi:hypothetical protein